MMIDEAAGGRDAVVSSNPALSPGTHPLQTVSPPSRRHPLFSSRARPLHMRTRRRRAAEMVKMKIDSGRWP